MASRTIVAMLCLFLSVLSQAGTEPIKNAEKFNSHGFTDAQVFKPAHDTKAVVIFLRPLWLGREADDIGKRLSRQGLLVISVNPYLFKIPEINDKHRQCATWSDCLIALSAYVQKRQGYRENQNPALMSIENTGEFAELAWREAPIAAFSTVISVDYCPQKPLLAPLPRERLTKWTLLQSPGKDTPCSPHASGFVQFLYIDRARISVSPRVRSGPMLRMITKRVIEMGHTELRKPASIGPIALDDIRPILVEPPGEEKSPSAFVILYSGDGGWAEFADEMAKEFAARKIPVVGINSMRYFWKAKPPEQGAKDLERLIRHYSGQFKTKKVHLVGFSFGAGVLPFFVSRLPADIKATVETVAMVAPYRKADFEFFLSDWFFDDDRGVEVLPEVKRLKISARKVCVFPTQEKKFSLCTQQEDASEKNKESTDILKTVELPGGHHFDGQTSKVVQSVLESPTQTGNGG